MDRVFAFANDESMLMYEALQEGEHREKLKAMVDAYNPEEDEIGALGHNIKNYVRELVGLEDFGSWQVDELCGFEAVCACAFDRLDFENIAAAAFLGVSLDNWDDRIKQELELERISEPQATH
jgi:hypothetical protein